MLLNIKAKSFLVYLGEHLVPSDHSLSPNWGDFVTV